MTAWGKGILFVAVAIVTLAYTGPTVVRLLQIRGWVPGGVKETVTLTQKWLEPGGKEASSPLQHYWVAWTAQDIREPGHHRLELPASVWDRLEVGAPVEITRVAGEPAPHSPLGLTATDEAIGLHAIFLTAELVFLVAFAWLTARSWRRQRQLPPPPDWCQLPPE